MPVSVVVCAIMLVLACGVDSASAEVMTSTDYSIQSDSLNFGGLRSASGAYAMEDTLGEVATGVSSSTDYTMNAGYQQMQETAISIVPPSNVTLSPAIGGLSGGTSNGQTSFTVTTDDPAGYMVTIVASTSPALTSGSDSFADYQPAGAAPDFTFTNAATASTFGFTPEGADIASRYKDDGLGTCGTGSTDTANACWDGLSTSAKTIVSRATANQPAGVVTTLKFRAASGSSHVQASGLYTATTTITVIPQ